MIGVYFLSVFAGSLLVGINVAKTLAWVYGKPLIGVNHLEGHLYAAWLLDAGELLDARAVHADRPDAAEDGIVGGKRRRCGWC